MPITPQIKLFRRIRAVHSWVKGLTRPKVSSVTGTLVGYGSHPRQVFIVEDETQEVLRTLTNLGMLEWVKGCPLPAPVEARLETTLLGRHRLLQLSSRRPLDSLQPLR